MKLNISLQFQVFGFAMKVLQFVLSFFFIVASVIAKNHAERTLIIVKPDGIQRGLIGEVMTRFENKQYKLVAMKMVMPTRKLLEQHYAVHKEKFFFNTLIEYMMGGPLIPMVWEGYNVVDTGRKIIGLTQPSLSPVGTIRGDYAINVNYTIVHGAHSIEEAKAEINLWFKKDDFVTYNVLEC